MKSDKPWCEKVERELEEEEGERERGGGGGEEERGCAETWRPLSFGLSYQCFSVVFFL
jgi:hypothetical protein